MRVYTYSEAHQRLTEVLDIAHDEEVVIKRRGGETFSVVFKRKTFLKRSETHEPAKPNKRRTGKGYWGANNQDLVMSFRNSGAVAVFCQISVLKTLPPEIFRCRTQLQHVSLLDNLFGRHSAIDFGL